MPNFPMKLIKQLFHSELSATLVIILLGALLSCFFKITHQITFISPDELLWILRSNIFVEHFLSGNFSGLIQLSQPGIMVMWFTGPMMYLSHFNFELITNLLADLNQAGIPYNVINSNNPIYYQPYQKISFLFNLPLLSILFLFALCFYASLRKLKFSKIKSLAALAFLTSSSFYFLFFTTPTDKLVAIFMTLSLFSLLIYVNDGHKGEISPRSRKKYLIISAILAASAVLSKLSALFLLPFTLLVLFIYSRKNIKNIFKDYLLWIIIFLITAIIFLPTIITNQEIVINLLLNNGQDRLIVNSSGTNSSNSFLFIAVALTYLSDSSLISLGPLALICLIIFFVSVFFRWFRSGNISMKSKRKSRKFGSTALERLQNQRNFISLSKRAREISFILTLYLFLFFISIATFSKTYSFRYLAPLFPIIYLLAGIGLVNLTDLIIKKFRVPKKLAYSEMIILIFLSQLLFIFTSRIEEIESLPDFH